jgi:hypothetical protein
VARTHWLPLSASFGLTLWLSGCCSPYAADRGALTGGLLGAGTGAVVGHALGSTGAGAAIGAGVGALSGAAIGSHIDETEARNRALIAQQLGREIAANAVTINDVIAMTQAHVNEDLIVNHIRAHRMAAPLTTNDLINLPRYGVSPRVIAEMQAAPPGPVVVQPPPPPVVVEEPYYGPHVYVVPHYYHHW